MQPNHHRGTLQRLALALFTPAPIATVLLYMSYLLSGGFSDFEPTADAKGLLITILFAYGFVGVPGFLCGLIMEFLFLRRRTAAWLSLLAAAGLGFACSLLLFRADPWSNLQISVVGILTGLLVGRWLLRSYQRRNPTELEGEADV